jgi:Cu2+-containing amine oxidase
MSEQINCCHFLQHMLRAAYRYHEGAGRKTPHFQKSLCLLVAFLAISVAPSLLSAQAPLDPLTSAEKEQATKVLLGDPRMRQAIGISSSYRIVNIERHEEDKGIAATGGRRADVIMYNYATDETISCVVNLGSNPRVDAMKITKDLPSALSPEEVNEAKRLALADPIVQARLGSAGITEHPLIITYLLARVQTNPACSTHRCLMLFFNTQDAALDINVVVDLSAQRVFSQ